MCSLWASPSKKRRSGPLWNARTSATEGKWCGGVLLRLALLLGRGRAGKKKVFSQVSGESCMRKVVGGTMVKGNRERHFLEALCHENLPN